MDYSLSNLKLQKMLYFIQVYFLTQEKTKQPCFKEEIEAWDFGPVVPVAYHEYKQFGSTNIPKVDAYIEYDSRDFWKSKIKPYSDSMISDDHKGIIKQLVDMLSKYSTTRLVQITHNQRPWKDAYQNDKDKTITIASLRSYFHA